MVFAGVSRIRMSSMLCVEGVVISAASLFSSVLSVDLYLTFFVSFFCWRRQERKRRRRWRRWRIWRWIKRKGEKIEEENKRQEPRSKRRRRLRRLMRRGEEELGGGEEIKKKKWRSRRWSSKRSRQLNRTDTATLVQRHQSLWRTD